MVLADLYRVRGKEGLRLLQNVLRDAYLLGCDQHAWGDRYERRGSPVRLLRMMILVLCFYYVYD